MNHPGFSRYYCCYYYCYCAAKTAQYTRNLIDRSLPRRALSFGTSPSGMASVLEDGTAKAAAAKINPRDADRIGLIEN